MLGFEVKVSRLRENRDAPAQFDSAKGELVAAWRAQGAYWLTRLVQAGLAVDLGGSGYPGRWSVKAKDLLPLLAGDLPEVKTDFVWRGSWRTHPPDIVPSVQVPVSKGAAKSCDPEEWLVVEAWDES